MQTPLAFSSENVELKTPHRPAIINENQTSSNHWHFAKIECSAVEGSSTISCINTITSKLFINPLFQVSLAMLLLALSCQELPFPGTVLLHLVLNTVAQIKLYVTGCLGLYEIHSPIYFPLQMPLPPTFWGKLLWHVDFNYTWASRYSTQGYVCFNVY